MKKLETKSMVLLKHHLKALRLPTIHAECEKVANRCACDNVDHLGFLLQLCELELIEREKRAADRRLKAAKFPNLKTLEAFDFTAQPSINRLLVMELMRSCVGPVNRFGRVTTMRSPSQPSMPGVNSSLTVTVVA